MDSREIAIICAKIADDKKAKDIVILDISKLLIITDYFVICSVESDRQAKTIANEIEKILKQKEKIRYSGREGYNEGKWILLDYQDVVVHIYLQEVRKYYELEELWADAAKVEWEGIPVSITIE